MGLRITVNGVNREVAADPSDPLLWVLRDDLALASPKYGCGLEQCGACRVLVDGAPTPSCTLPVGDLAGRTVTTLEGLAGDPATEAVQRALLDRNAGQCAYCLPGIVVTLSRLAAGDGGRPDRDAVVAALDDHLCRCGSQPRILAAAFAALGLADGDSGGDGDGDDGPRKPNGSGGDGG